MSTRIEPLTTIADLDAMPDDTNRYEIIKGELFVSRAPGLTHQTVIAESIAAFSIYFLRRPIGKIIPTPGLILSKFDGVIPDLVFVTHERLARIRAEERLVAAPELVIEIISPGAENSRRDRVAKRQLYAQHGVEEYWIVDPLMRAIEIYRLKDGAPEQIAELRDADVITSPLLPEFALKVESFFA